MGKRKTSNNQKIDKEIISKGKDIYNDFDDSKEVFVKPKKMENKLISIRLPMQMIKDLRTIARIKGDIGYQQIIKTYISDGLTLDKKRIQSDVREQTVYCEIMNASSSSSINEEFPHESFVSGTYEYANL